MPLTDDSKAQLVELEYDFVRAINTLDDLCGAVCRQLVRVNLYDTAAVHARLVRIRGELEQILADIDAPITAAVAN